MLSSRRKKLGPWIPPPPRLALSAKRPGGAKRTIGIKCQASKKRTPRGERGMSAAPSPCNSETPTVGLTIDEAVAAFSHALGSGPPLSASETAEAWILGLEAGGEVPTREQLIGLLGALLQERSLPALTVTDGALGAVNAADAFLRVEFVPHLVLPGDELEQCQSKMTYVVVRLVNGQGQPIDGTTVQSGGLKLMVTLVNNTTGQTLQQNPKKPTQALLAGSAGGVYEPCAAASACSL